MTASAQPHYFSGFLAPVPDEIDAVDLTVTGTLPTGLSGRYFRNGPNPLPGTDPGHNFTGLGMVHGIHLTGGRARWYRNRWVRTPLFNAGDSTVDRSTPGATLLANISNTSVLHHGGRILSLVENGFPYEITPELETVGPCDFGGRLTTAMTAHPKVDPVTGELFFFGYGVRPPYLTYHVASAGGELLRSVEITVGGPTMMHDFALTQHHVVWLDLPVVWDRAGIDKPGMVYRWSEDYPARIGVMPRTGGDADVRWIEVPPGYIFHVGNAYEDAQGRIVLEAIGYDPAAFNTLWARLGGTTTPVHALATTSADQGTLRRWVLDPVAGTARCEALDDLAAEFPTINDERTGLSHRYIYAATNTLFGDDNGAIIRCDTTSGARQVWDMGEDWMPGEAEFVPAPDADAEDAGWLLSIVTHRTADAAQLVVLDAGAVAAGPVATVHLPRRVPAGFHGTWIPDDNTSQ